MAENGPTRTASRQVGTALVDAAERVLVRDGLTGLTVRAVAAEAGVAPMGVYNRFGNKDGLVAAVLVRGFDGLTAALSEETGSDGATARLMTCGRGYRRFALAWPRHYEAMFGTALSAGDRTAAQDDELVEHAGAAFGVLVDQVTRAMDAGVLRRADPACTAQLIWSAVHGAVSLELAGVTQIEDPAASYEQLLQLVVQGLG
jgi:AcrR family transcriptional regulator